MPLVSGREFGRLDTAAGEPVAIVDREFARRYFPGRGPVGQHLRIAESGTQAPWRTVVGVAGDLKETNPFDEMHWKIQPHVYVPFAQGEPTSGLQRVVLMRAGPRWLGREGQPLDTLVSALRRRVASIDPTLPLSEVTGLRRFMEREAYAKPGLRAAVCSGFATLALLMTVIGLYGVMSQLVLERRRDLGLRMALGATPGSLIGLVVGRSLMLTSVGIALGAVGSATAIWLMRRFLLTSPGRPLILVGVAAVMLAIAAIAGLAPAWRAARIDPVTALRED
jgi:hypothetical protein